MIEVTFRDRRTNTTIVRKQDDAWTGENSSFWWSQDGNGGCDCNRSSYMYEREPAQKVDCAGRNLIVIDSICHEGAVVYQDAPEVRGDGSEADQRNALLDSAVRQLSNVQAALIDTGYDFADEVKKARAALFTINAAPLSAPMQVAALSLVEAGERIAAAFATPEASCAQSDIDIVDRCTQQLRSGVPEHLLAVVGTPRPLTGNSIVDEPIALDRPDKSPSIAPPKRLVVGVELGHLVDPAHPYLAYGSLPNNRRQPDNVPFVPGDKIYVHGLAGGSEDPED
jgi:hypothetical protein